MLKFAVMFAILCSSFAHAFSISEEILKCRSVIDTVNKLACYDNISLPHQTLVEMPLQISENNPIQIVKPLESQTNVNQNKQTFGQDHLLTNAQREHDTADYIIKHVELTLKHKLKFTFINGQVWLQKDNNKRARFEVGNKVIIKRGVMNAFHLKKEGSKRLIRVQRID